MFVNNQDYQEWREYTEKKEDTIHDSASDVTVDEESLLERPLLNR